jgi:hypothetical protein
MRTSRSTDKWAPHAVGLVMILVGVVIAAAILARLATGVEDAVDDRVAFLDRPEAWEIVDQTLPRFKGWYRNERRVMTVAMELVLQQALDEHDRRFRGGQLHFGPKGTVVGGWFDFGGCDQYNYKPGYRARRIEPLNDDWYITRVDSCIYFD